MKQKQTDQLNFSATPILIIQRFKDFAHDFRKKKKVKASDSQIGAMVLEVGLEHCEKELKTKKEHE